MAKRARYDGPHEKVVVHWPPGETAVGSDEYQTWEVEQGSLLPAEAPAKLRDELVSQEGWSEVDQSGGRSKSDEGKE